jgi:hypothetical protein
VCGPSEGEGDAGKSLGALWPREVWAIARRTHQEVAGSRCRNEIARRRRTARVGKPESLRCATALADADESKMPRAAMKPSEPDKRTTCTRACADVVRDWWVGTASRAHRLRSLKWATAARDRRSDRSRGGCVGRPHRLDGRARMCEHRRPAMRHCLTIEPRTPDFGTEGQRPYHPRAKASPTSNAQTYSDVRWVLSPPRSGMFSPDEGVYTQRGIMQAMGAENGQIVARSHDLNQCVPQWHRVSWCKVGLGEGGAESPGNDVDNNVENSVGVVVGPQ